jgi:hypothetical protein
MRTPSIWTAKPDYSEIEHFALEGMAGDDLAVLLPLSVPFEIRDHPLGLIAGVVVYDEMLDQVVVDEITVRRRHPGDEFNVGSSHFGGDQIAARAIRGLHLHEIARDVVKAVGGVARFVGPGRWDLEPITGTVPDLVAERLAHGRSKSQRLAEVEQRRAVALHKQVLAEEFEGDVYDEVAKRMHAGRTTVYGYLRRAGVVKANRNRKDQS